VIFGVLLVKWFIWAVSLGSGTSGGVLAPLLMMGGALGGLEAMFLPNEGAGFWPLISMGAILGGTMRSPFTSIVFAFELTHDANVFLPLLVGSIIAHAFTVLTLKRSILTEKVARRGYHLSREYAVDPLELLYAREVMQTSILALPGSTVLGDIVKSPQWQQVQAQRLLPIVDGNERLLGVVTAEDIRRWVEDDGGVSKHMLGELVRADAVSTDSDETLRVIVHRMAESGLTRMPVVARAGGKLQGMVALDAVLKARTRHLEEERRREQALGWRYFIGPRRESAKADS
jgi:CIC family chloride channel protein